MSQNVVSIPNELFEADLPPGYQCTLNIGRMVGKLGPMPNNPGIQQFSFEMTDADDPTEMVLYYVTYEAAADKLARWENAGDTVGIVIAQKGKRIDMVLAYNFTRQKWFATGYYPHVRATGLENYFTVTEIQRYGVLCIPLIPFCCIGLVGIAAMMSVSAKKTQQYKTLNPTDFRGVTARRIAEWIAKNGPELAKSGNPALDPSL